MFICLKTVDNFTSSAGSLDNFAVAPIMQIKHLANHVPEDLNTDPVIYINDPQTLQLALLNSIRASESLPNPMPVGFIPNTGCNGVNSNPGMDEGGYDARLWGRHRNATINVEDFNIASKARRDNKRGL